MMRATSTRATTVARRPAIAVSSLHRSTSLRPSARIASRTIPRSMPSQFDERPTEPVPEAVQTMSAQLMEQMREKIQTALNADLVVVKDAYGDGRHVSIDVVSKEFEEKSSMQRQRLVYKAIWLELMDKVHAVDAMTTKTPAEAGMS